MSNDRLDCEGNPIPEGMHEYAFDAKLFAVVRVVAPNLESAIRNMESVIDAMAPTDQFIKGFNDAAKVKITEVSLGEDGEDENRTPFEIDGEDV